VSRVAVVTGASSGIGAELVRTLQARGWHVVGLSRRLSEADEHEACDVADRAAVEAVAARVLARHERIDLLVCNAGQSAGSPDFLGAEPGRIEGVIATNYLGSVWTTLAFLPGLGAGSHVVNVVSVAGEVAYGPYSASKHAQLAFSRAISIELAPRGISVHTVKPGFVETPGFPQRNRGLLVSKLAVDPPLVVDRILGAIEHDRRELTVPRWYRVIGVVQALLPATFTRLRQAVRR
jgi:NAD(P)-dependent dehydrogenase (short-subunit alcohol dehydrogenase family)